jgi:hypothetical protein
LSGKMYGAPRKNKNNPSLVKCAHLSFIMES